MKVTKSEKALTGCVPEYNPQWDAYMQVPKAFHDYMAEHGFEVIHTGGGCTAWERVDADRHSTWITDGETGLGEWADRDKPMWMVGRHCGEEVEEQGEIALLELVTLERAMELAPLLGTPYEDSFLTIDTVAQVLEHRDGLPSEEK